MENHNNVLRMYNVQNLFNTKMHIYTKKCVDTAVTLGLLGECYVNVVNLTEKDINELKKNCDEKSYREYMARNYNFEPPRKKIILHKENEEKVPETLKLVLSREGETDKFKSQFKTVSNEKDIPSTSSSAGVDNVAENQHSKESSTPVTVKKSEFINKIYVAPDEHLFYNKEDIMKYKILFGLTFDTASKRSSNGIKKSSTTPNSVKTVKSSTSATRSRVPLKEVERLHLKYFTKPVQDTIVIIANILNMISLSNRHHKSRMDESFKKKTEAEKLKERCDANRMHLRHKKVLEAKLKTNFLVVISMFAEQEFVLTFQLFFLSILTVLRVLDQPKFKKGSIFKNLVLLLWNSLKNSDFDHPKVFGMFRSKEFRPDCIDLITLIEDSRDSDPEIGERMAIYFITSINSREHFQPVIDVLTSDSNEDLSVLIDNASHKSRIYSQFNETPRDTSSCHVQEHAVPNIPPLSSAQSPATVPTMESVQQWLLSRTPNIPAQSLVPVQRENNINSQKTSVVISDAPVTNQPRMFYENFSNSLNQNNSVESGASGSSVPKITVVTAASVSNNAFGQPTLLIKQGVQNFKPVPSSSIQRSDFHTIFVGKKQYQLIHGPSGEVKAVAASSTTTAPTTNAVTTNVLIRPAISAAKPTVDITVRCFSKGCKNPAAIMCSKCQSVKYCSNTCQSKDWYDSHIHNCSRLQCMRPNNRGNISI